MINYKIRRFFCVFSFVSLALMPAAAKAVPTWAQFKCGDYDGVIAEASSRPVPANYYSKASDVHVRPEELFYILASLDPFTDPFRGNPVHNDFVGIIQAVDLNASPPPDTIPSPNPVGNPVTRMFRSNPLAPVDPNTLGLHDQLWMFISKPKHPCTQEDAQLVTALLHLNTAFTPQHANPERGLQLLKSLAEAKHSHACFWMGRLLNTGNLSLVPRNVPASVDMFRDAGLHVQAVKELSVMGDFERKKVAVRVFKKKTVAVDSQAAKVLNKRDDTELENINKYTSHIDSSRLAAMVFDYCAVALATSAPIVTFVGSGTSNDTISFVGGALSTGALGFAGLAKYLRGDAKAYQVKINQIYEKYGIDPIDALPGTTVSEENEV